MADSNNAVNVVFFIGYLFWIVINDLKVGGCAAGKAPVVTESGIVVTERFFAVMKCRDRSG